MITMYPHDADWDGIARPPATAAGAPRDAAWFERLEACAYVDRPRVLPRNHLLARVVARLPWISDRYVNRGRHGFDGWLSTSLPDPSWRWATPRWCRS